MPREQVEWYLKESLHDNDKIHARQCSTYYSIVNVNKIKYPYSSSVEQEQMWTLTQTMSNHNKRYLTSIENIHLAMPSILTVKTPVLNDTSSNINHNDYENNKMKADHSISLLPPLPPSRQHLLSSHRLNRVSIDSNLLHHQQQQQQHQKTLPIKTMTNNNSSSKTNSINKKTRSIINPMRIIHLNGELIVRI